MKNGSKKKKFGIFYIVVQFGLHVCIDFTWGGVRVSLHVGDYWLSLLIILHIICVLNEVIILHACTSICMF